VIVVLTARSVSHPFPVEFEFGFGFEMIESFVVSSKNLGRLYNTENKVTGITNVRVE
jgi:hypothetical protein